MQKRIHIFYSGRVQGVGFRFTCEDIANDLNVSGWVKNLYDSRVEVVAEQEEGVLNLFLQRIESYFKNYIGDKQISWEEPTGEFKGFQIS